MATLPDYLTWRGDLTFSRSPFNPVDNIILSLLSYFPFDGIVSGYDDSRRKADCISLEDAANRLFERWGKETVPVKQPIQSKDAPRVLALAGSSERFRHIGLSGYVNHIDIDAEVQFSAITYTLNGGNQRGSRQTPEYYIAFRGTDDTLIGWKEDFNMMFKTAVPAQLEAVSYVQRMAARFKRGGVRLGGHSKGGNLAAYAAAFCGETIQKRICAVYRNDSPGFNAGIIAREGYQAIRPKIQSFIPESSVIGMLFEYDGEYTVIKSRQTGLMQHDAYSWEVTYNDVARAEAVSASSRFIDRTLKEWISGLDTEQRRRFVEAFYDILSATEAQSLQELTDQWFKNARIILHALNGMDKETKALMEKTLAALFKAARRNLHYLT
jgi:hypothetical protein